MRNDETTWKGDGEDEDEPASQYLKVVHVLDCVPGHTEAPTKGLPIAILTLEHNGEVEQPLMFKVPDVKRLAVDLLAVLAHHGNEVAQEVVDRYFNLKDRDET